MPLEELQLLIAGYVLGDLDPEEAAEFEQLLASDPAIAAEVDQMQNALEICYAPPAISPAPQLRSTILEAFEAEQNPVRVSQSRADSRLKLSGSRFAWNRIVGVAAAALIAALGINNYRLWQTLQTVQSEPQPGSTLTYGLQGTKKAQDASATIAVNPDTLEATLTTQNLPPLPPGKTYALWTVLKPGAPFTTDSKGAILTKTFQANQPNKSQTFRVPEVFRSQDLVAKVAVTIEDAKSPQAHLGSPILITN